MKFREVDTVTSHEDYLRLRIYDGDLPIDEAGRELVESLLLRCAQLEDEVVRLRAATAEWIKANAAAITAQYVGLASIEVRR